MPHRNDETGPRDSGYLLVGTLASGGMARVSVVLRHQGEFRRLYALKRLLEPLQADEHVQAMFLDEARFAGMIRHSHVVSVLDMGIDHEGPFLVMEFVDGVAVDTLLQHHSANGLDVPCQVAARIASQVARGLHAAHELCGPTGEPLHLVHRDVSPQNILLGFDGVAKVTDFGIAKAASQSTKTSTGIIKGKLGYLSPEQLRFEEPDRRSDLFALGVVLFELLSGQRLYRNRQGMDGARRILSESPPDIQDFRNDVPPDLVDLLFRLLAKDPAHRPASALVVARTLDDIVAEQAVLDGVVDVGEYLLAHLHAQRAKTKKLIDDGLQRIAAEAEAAAESHAAASPTAFGQTPAPHRAAPHRAAVPQATASRSRASAATPVATRDGAARVTPAPPAYARIRWIAVAAVIAVGAATTGWVTYTSDSIALQPLAPPPVPLVSVDIESDPSGATATLADGVAGRTPLTLLFPRSSDQLTMTIARPGFADAVESVSLASSSRVRVSLRPLRDDVADDASTPGPDRSVKPTAPATTSVRHRQPAPVPRRPPPPRALVHPAPTSPRIRRIGER
ncbi:MAG: serine/threonine-protein kinase [Myxococcota bacterium]